MTLGTSRRAAGILFVISILCSVLTVYAGEQETRIDVEELESRVKEILREDNVTMRRHVDDVFLLADVYAREGRDMEAMRLYEKALQVDSWRFDYQMKMAHLMHKHGDNAGAIEKAGIVCSNTKNMALYREAKNLLTKLGADCEEPAYLETEEIARDVEIVMAPVGKVDRRLLKDVTQELQKILGITYSIEDKELRLDRVDRKSDERYLTIMAERIRASVPEHEMEEFLSEKHFTDADLKTYDGKVRFIEAALHEAKAPKEDIRAFREMLRQLKGTGQYDAHRLLAEIEKHYPLGSRPEVKGYLGVTGEDIFARDFNFLFGWAGKGHGLMSYHRFTNEFNGEPPNREAVRKRTVKQAISSSMYILGIPRCSTPTCARAYPHSLSEHDRKGIEICAQCRGLLKAYIEMNSVATATSENF